MLLQVCGFKKTLLVAAGRRLGAKRQVEGDALFQVSNDWGWPRGWQGRGGQWIDTGQG